MENYHYLSHRRLSHDSSGAVIPNSHVLHHYVDRNFARAFKHLVDRLSAYTLPDATRLVDAGVAVWYNDNGDGPPHSPRNTPFILAGSCGGFFRQGEHVELPGGDAPNHNKMLNTIGTAVGLRNAAGDGPLDDFGDPSLPGGIFPELMA
jgi:hypothetical protein